MTTTQRSVCILNPRRHSDSRGWFAETYNRTTFATLGIDTIFVQDNHSYSKFPFTLRGLHFQIPPLEQEKLIGCVRGRVFDVAVDVRRHSPSYGQWVGTELSAENGNQLYVPAGFAHGFVTLEPDCEVTYKCSNTYALAADAGIRWDSVGIDWRIPPGVAPVLSDKDSAQPTLAEFDSPFNYSGQPLAPLS